MGDSASNQVLGLESWTGEEVNWRLDWMPEIKRQGLTRVLTSDLVRSGRWSVE